MPRGPAFATSGAMCAKRKQRLNTVLPIVAAAFTLAGGAVGAEMHLGDAAGQQSQESAPRSAAAGGVAVGDGSAGVTDRAWVMAPPHYSYVVERAPGSFLDCGAGQETRSADADGRDMAPLRCGVTLTETIVIPAAATSARIIIHF